MCFHLIAKALFVLEILKYLRFFPGWPAIFAMKTQEQFKNILRTHQYFSRT